MVNDIEHPASDPGVAAQNLSSAAAQSDKPQPDDQLFAGPLFAGPIKRSITIARHQTSISLEPVFWAALRRAAQQEGIAINALVARIDEERIASLPDAMKQDYQLANLASAIRCWLWARNITSVD
ncbi:MAG: hypothetical protein E2598_05515 [Sphingobium sp.]|nr:hypothetical protein [Sphingobium sp.]